MAHSGKTMTFATDLVPQEDNIYSLGDFDQKWKIHGKIQPLVTKTWASTSYYATAANQATSTWFFMSIKPDSWYKPWRVRFKIRTYCPGHTNCDSVTYSTYSGRADSYIAHNWNERYDHAHYYTTVRMLKNAGFTAGLGHALGVSILYANGYTNSGYYRTFELEYYDCEGCTVTVLDNPVLWTGWANGTDTNYGGYSNFNAVDRGLQESGDATGDTSDRTLQTPRYLRFKSGAAGIGRYTLVMEESTGVYSSITTTFATSNQPTTITNMAMNTSVKYRIGRIFWHNQNADRAANTNIAYDAQYWQQYDLIDIRFSFNVTMGGLTAYAPFYMVGTLDSDGLFTLNPTATAWTQTLPTSISGNTVYVYLGTVYPDTSTYRVALELHHPIYRSASKQVHGGDITGNAATASSVNWTNVQGRPTNLNQFTNGPGYVTSSGVTSIATGAGLSGGTITNTGTISINGMNTSSGSTSKWLNQKGEWTTPPDTKYTLPAATSGALGGIKIGYNTSGTNYKVQLDSNSNAYVNVPWTDTNNKVTQAYSTADKLYPLLMSVTDGITSTNTRGDTTAILNNALYANPNKGSLYATTLHIDKQVTLQYNDTDQSLEFIF